MEIKQKGIYLIGSALVTIGLLAGCGSSEESAPEKDKPVEEPKQQQKEETEQQKDKPIASEESKNDNVIKISAFEMGYTPPSVTLEEGKEYTLVLKNNGKIFHDLTAKKLDVKITHMGKMPDHPEKMSFSDEIDKILGLNKVHASGSHDDGHGEEENYIHMNARSGQTVKIKFIPQETGEFKFFCSVPGHEEAGMHGGIEIE
ncbi:Copper binding protein, plastocyanin/azurin family [Virgibacillus subterraneus]|uniref:Copper binding protein, plastocyanin/azurin family n=1 Tax=Virgibacillus subterraneus TaxID=621109 RepID=A0A1H9I6Z1_9BACI|nr:plastocyanin/azurin family copper-binding protein [Virgibacillus subterraneus]SEQ70334.1 Copper binding protein, plastocyanin/azurin family [Virgibacillus subterraneus]